MNRYLTLLAFLVLFSCKKSEKEPELIQEIAPVTAEIENMIMPKTCVTKEQDCRLKVINSSDACGPAFAYNVNDVDLEKLLDKFSLLENLKNNYWNAATQKGTGYWVSPNSTSIVDCKCTAAYKY